MSSTNTSTVATTHAIPASHVRALVAHASKEMGRYAIRGIALGATHRATDGRALMIVPGTEGADGSTIVELDTVKALARKKAGGPVTIGGEWPDTNLSNPVLRVERDGMAGPGVVLEDVRFPDAGVDSIVAGHASRETVAVYLNPAFLARAAKALLEILEEDQPNEVVRAVKLEVAKENAGGHAVALSVELQSGERATAFIMPVNVS